MPEPRIQYAKTSDGVNIAFWEMGEGMPFVHMAGPPWSHIQAEWMMAESRAWYEQLARTKRLIRYDNRGCGLSEREAADFTMDAQMRDLEAVVDHLGLSKFALYSPITAGPVAIAYAARRPERISKLVLWCSYMRYADLFRFEQIRGFHALRATDWEMYTETSANVVFGWTAGEPARRLATFLRQCTTQVTAEAYFREIQEFDATGLVRRITAPTLVLHQQEIPWLPTSFGQALAAQIPDSRLVILEGRSAAPYWEDAQKVAAVIDEFLVDDLSQAEGQIALPEGTAVILFVDIADSTALTSQLGDAAYREKERALDTALRQAIGNAGGTPVEGKLLGDGVLAVFSSARQAIDAALRCRDLGDEAGLPLHLGIHAGDVIREGKDVHGGAVQLAARIHDVAAAGEVLVSDVIRALARTSAGVGFEDRGEHELKGIAEPQRLFAVRAEGSPEETAG